MSSVRTAPDETAEPLTGGFPVVLHANLDQEQFVALCEKNDLYRLELTAEGDLVIMPPTFFDSGERNAELTTQLRLWAKKDGSGRVVDSSGGYVLPDGANRSPDASWTLRTRVDALPAGSTGRFLPLCPDFVVELRSTSDRLVSIKNKMTKYIDNGARLGLLLDPVDRKVYVYRPGVPLGELHDPATVDCSPELPGFVLDVRAVFDPAG